MTNTRRLQGLISSRCLRTVRVALVFAVVFAPAVLAIPLAQAQTFTLGGSNPRQSGSQVIQHVVVIFQENRTPDNLFQDPNLIANGADIRDYGYNSHGKRITLRPQHLANSYDPRHRHADFVAMYDNGNMDGADKIPLTCNKRAKHCPPPDPQFKYVIPADVAPYFHLAEKYTFADRMFQTNQGPSFPAHQFIFSGTSAPTATSGLFAAEIPMGVPGAIFNTGCTAPPQEYVFNVDPQGNESSVQYPCYEHLTLGDLLDLQGLSWRYYTALANSLWTAPNAIYHLRFGPDWKNDVIPNQKQILSDIADGQLPSMSWVIPTWAASDHPGSTDGTGPSWVASIVNAIGNSQYWNSTAIFITWDDWGGWYDHVAPPQVLVDCEQWGCGYVYGFRVPLVVVSPYAKQSYISHVNHDFGSILKFTEEVFNLPSLGYADAYADDLSDCFNFSQGPKKFHTIAAPHDADYFFSDRRPTDSDAD
jgi:phospholipase C